MVLKVRACPWFNADRLPGKPNGYYQQRYSSFELHVFGSVGAEYYFVQINKNSLFSILWSWIIIHGSLCDLSTSLNGTLSIFITSSGIHSFIWEISWRFNLKTSIYLWWPVRLHIRGWWHTRLKWLNWQWQWLNLWSGISFFLKAQHA